MDFGIALDFGSASEPLRLRLLESRDLLAAAEKCGFTSLWAGEQHPTARDHFHVPAPMLVLAALAQSTEMTLGTGVTLLPSWNALRLAYEAAVLDQIANGRLILGVGLGTSELDKRYGGTGTGLGNKADEMLAALRSSWSGDELHPKPVQLTGPPIWVGGLAPRAIARAAQLGNGWYAATSYRREEDIVPAVERYRAAVADAGVALGEIAANRLCFVAPTDDEAWAIARRFGERTLEYYAAVGALGPSIPGPDTRSDLVDRFGAALALIGSPRSVASQIDAYRRAGVTNLQLRVWPSGMPAALASRTIRLFGERVLPQFAL